ncbi:MAG: GspH/FimT family pseudopilin [Pseudomonas sp.]|nr:GspH/FimT family pseudopilin [Pseudomonas sp.]
MASRRNGFTLIEMLVTVVVLGILATIAIPSFTSLINNNRADSETSDLYRTLNYARLEAITRGVNVRVVPATAGTWNGILNVYASADLTTVLRSVSAMSSKATVTMSVSTAGYIEFNNLGALNYPTAALTLAYTQGTATRNVSVCLNGRVIQSGTCS